MKTLFTSILAAAVCFGASFAHAVGQEGHGGGAGHTYFVSTVYDLIQALKKPVMRPILTELNVSANVISQAFDPSKVIVTTDQLRDDLGNAVDAVVINDKQNHIIKINKKSWDNFEVQGADVDMLVLKELLRFAGYDHSNEAIEKAQIILQAMKQSNALKKDPVDIIAADPVVSALVNSVAQLQGLDCQSPRLAILMDGVGSNHFEIQYDCKPKHGPKGYAVITVIGLIAGTQVSLTQFSLDINPL